MLTTQERETLVQLLDQLTRATVPNKNAEADALIRAAVAKQPDAAYLLVQRAMLMEHALSNAKAQIAQLQTRLQSQRAGSSNSFLGGNPWKQPAEAAPNPAGVPGAGQYPMPRQGSALPAGPALGGGSFLGNVATTAAGVVAGSFLFQGIEHLLGHHPSGWASNGDFGREPVAEETVINNYYDSVPADGWNHQDGSDGFLASDDGDLFQGDSDDSDWV